MTNTITDVVVGSEDFDTLEAAVVAADLAGTLAGEGPFTVFAPTDDAFAALPAGLVDALVAEDPPDTLTAVLTYHVVSDEVPAATVVTLDSATTLNGDVAIQVDPDGDGAVVLNGTVRVTETDVEADNGLIHVIDGVLMPGNDFPGTVVDALSAYPRFSSLVDAVVTADLATTLSGEGPFTVFAPTNAAFAALGDPGLTPAELAEVLTYHVVGDEVLSPEVVTLATATTVNGAPIDIQVTQDGVWVNQAQVTFTDILTTNGVIHVIDAVLLPPGDIPTVATAAGFDTLVAAVVDADLAGTLGAPNGPYTVFAPTDAAFAALPTGVVDLLLNTDPPDLLTAILTNHVASGSLDSNAVGAATSVETLNGGAEVTVQIDGDTVVLDGTAQVSAVDVPAANGIIHVIDGVIIPRDTGFPGTVVDALVAYPRFSALVDAVITADLADDLSGTGPFTVLAPTNRAFEAIASTVAGLTPAELADILSYHVYVGEADSVTVAGLATIPTLLGTDISVNASGPGIVLNDSVNVTFADIQTENGIIHVIDAVLIPPG